MGAEQAADPDRGIPAWTGGWAVPGAAFSAGGFEAERPVRRITQENVVAFRDQLTPGQQLMFEHYGDTWAMNIYESQRTASFPEAVYAAARNNAKSAVLRREPSLVDGKKLLRSRVEGAQVSVPFPQPSTGLEAVWNHLLRWRGVHVEAYLTSVAVTTGGNYTPYVRQSVFAAPFARGEKDNVDALSGLRLAYMGKVVTPSLNSQNTTLIHEPLDYINSSPRRWDYLFRARKVFSTPPFKGDQPIVGSEGLKLYDQFEMYMGMPDSYDWTLVGKQVALVPYNTHRLRGELAGSRRDLDPVFQPRHVNPELLRYEPHRVWVVEGVLHQGMSHPFKRRRFYLDEDSWRILLAEAYNADHELISYSEDHTSYFPEGECLWTTLQTFYRFDRGRYLASFLDERIADIKFSDRINPILFTPNRLQTIAQ